MVKAFKYVALLEGISYIVLFINMLVVKKIDLTLYKTLLFPIGMGHGLLFIAYIYLAFAIKDLLKWTLKDYFMVNLASLLPFATFFIEKKYLNYAP